LREKKKKKNGFANLKGNEGMIGFGVSANSPSSSLLRKKSRKVSESRQSAFLQLFCVPSFGYWILVLGHL